MVEVYKTVIRGVIREWFQAYDDESLWRKIEPLIDAELAEREERKMRQMSTYARGQDRLDQDLANLLQEDGMDMILPAPPPSPGLPNPAAPVIKCHLMSNERELSKRRVYEGEPPEKAPFVFIIAAVDMPLMMTAKGARVTVDSIPYIVDTPLHPQYYQNSRVFMAITCFPA